MPGTRYERRVSGIVISKKDIPEGVPRGYTPPYFRFVR